jgi:drug/metabolite transporter (DMT)-like permease
MLGIALVVFASACFAALDTSGKLLTASVPVMMVMAFRFTFQALVTTAVVLPLRGLHGLRTRHLGLQIARGLLLVGSSAMAFTSLRYTPVAEFTAIVSLAPLLITLASAWRLKEPISLARWALVIGGFVGVLVIVRPTAENFHWGMLLAVVLVFTSAGYQLLTSHLAQFEDPSVTHLYTGWIGAVVAVIALPFVWQPVPEAWMWWVLTAVGLLATIGHFALILAYQRASPGVLTPFLYSQIVFAMLGGWVVFRQTPDAISLAGIALITLCGAVGTWLTVLEGRKRQGQAGGTNPKRHDSVFADSVEH